MIMAQHALGMKTMRILVAPSGAGIQVKMASLPEKHAVIAARLAAQVMTGQMILAQHALGMKPMRSLVAPSGVGIQVKMASLPEMHAVIAAPTRWIFNVIT